MIPRLADILAKRVRVPVQVRLNANRSSYLTFRTVREHGAEVIRLSVHILFAEAPDEVLEAVALWVARRETPESAAALKLYIHHIGERRAHARSSRQAPPTVEEPVPPPMPMPLFGTPPPPPQRAMPPAKAALEQDDLFGAVDGVPPPAPAAPKSPPAPAQRRTPDPGPPPSTALPRIAEQFASIDWPQGTAEARAALPPPPPGLTTEGRYHDLRRLGDMVNALYFDGTCPVWLTYGNDPRRLAERAELPVLRGRKPRRSSFHILLGTYNAVDHLVRIHPRLDAVDVPAYFVEFVIYHEMLHKAEPPRLLPSGRRDVHTRRFRHYERAFLRFREAKEFERQLLHRLMREAG